MPPEIAPAPSAPRGPPARIESISSHVKPERPPSIPWVTRWVPTNHLMLFHRALNKEIREPNSNKDFIAPIFRDYLMPRAAWLRCLAPWSVGYYHSLVESPNRAPGTTNFIDCRTQWLDVAVAGAIGQGMKQVVILACGFDTRSYRLKTLPDVKFFEVDMPPVIQKKIALVDATLDPIQYPRPIYVPADLSSTTLQEALASTAFDANLPTLFLVEGLLYYLPERAASACIQGISDLAADGSRLLFDFLHEDALLGIKKYAGFAATEASVSVKGEPFRSGLDHSSDAVSDMLASHGLRLKELLGPREMVDRFKPHLADKDVDGPQPPILPFYSFVEAIKVV